MGVLLILLVGGMAALQALDRSTPTPGDQRRAELSGPSAFRDARRELARQELERRRRERLGE